MDHYMSEREKRNDRFARSFAVESIVLLKNRGILPLEASAKISLLGKGASFTVKGGTGSGDVNNRSSVSIYKGLKNTGALFSSEEWVESYQEIYKKAREDWKNKILKDCQIYDNPFDAYAANPFRFPEGKPVGQEDIQGADCAIYVISRLSGEGKDRRLEKGDYYLSDQEREDLIFLTGKLPVILVINAGGMIDITDFAQGKNLAAILQISDLGQAGGDALADILYGKETPSGHLTFTWAKKYEDYPKAESFGYLSGDLSQTSYQEDIFMGYRHFDRQDISPLYPFGFGLSYTSFELHSPKIEWDGQNYLLRLTVFNTGIHYKGKAVVQCYAKLPAGELEKEKKRLVGFAKTDLLEPGECQRIEIAFDKKCMASFSEEKHTWILEAGEYGIQYGLQSGELQTAGSFLIEETQVVEATLPLDFQDMGQKQAVELTQEESKLTKDYTAQELLPLLCGNITDVSSFLGCAGTRVPGSAGETSLALLPTHGLPSLIMADGPAGLRLQQCYEVNGQDGSVYGLGVLGALDGGYLQPMEHHEGAEIHYQYCTAFPVGSALAQSWNTRLLETFGKCLGEEMQEFGVHLWLAPGMNLMRNPLCGRNFEYFSEDPLLTGLTASAIIQGAQDQPGCGVTMKHFACNNQEDNRMGVDVHVSERALRELYVRGFEIAAKKAKPKAIMTSYNRINGTHAANSYAICTTLLRKEWDFQGIVMSDWNTTVPQDGTLPEYAVTAGNDIIMPGNPRDAKVILEAYNKGVIGEAQVRKSAARIIKGIRELTKMGD